MIMANAATSDPRAASLSTANLRIALVGYGEVGSIFGAALASFGVQRVSAFDVRMTDEPWAAQAHARATRDRVVLATSTEEAVRDAHLVISAVTAAATLAASEQIARSCAPEAFVLDVNSASPQTKRACADGIARSNARYVEAAVMSSVPPHGLRVPMLLGGPHAEGIMPLLDRLGFDAKLGASTYGVVSAIKLCRSVIVKGIEALAIESLLTARRYGVEREVLASLAETFPGMDWNRQATWSWQRVVQHGRRRAEEMREAAVTVREAGVEPRMASATADVQAWIAALRGDGAFDGASDKPEWRDLADRIARDPPRSAGE